MAQVPSLLQRARDRGRTPAEGSGAFKKPDISAMVPAEVKDAVERVVAAGMRVMYSPDTREDLMAEVDRPGPVSQKLAESVAGLLLTLDSQSRGGIPVAAIFPAGMELLGEGAELLVAAGQPVTQADYTTAAQMLFVVLGKKLGASDEDLMGAAERAAGGASVAAEEGAAPEPEVEPPPEDAPEPEEEGV